MTIILAAEVGFVIESARNVGSFNMMVFDKLAKKMRSSTESKKLVRGGRREEVGSCT